MGGGLREWGREGWSSTRAEAFGFLASLWWVIGKRKWVGDVEWHIDNQGVVSDSETVRESDWSHTIEREDCDVWGIIKKILIDNERNDRVLKVCKVEGHVEDRKKSRWKWTEEERGNWLADKRAEEEYTRVRACVKKREIEVVGWVGWRRVWLEGEMITGNQRKKIREWIMSQKSTKYCTKKESKWRVVRDINNTVHDENNSRCWGVYQGAIHNV